MALAPPHDMTLAALAPTPPCSLAGLGLSKPGDVGVSLGTSDTIFSIVDKTLSKPGETRQAQATERCVCSLRRAAPLTSWSPPSKHQVSRATSSPTPSSHTRTW